MYYLAASLNQLLFFNVRLFHLYADNQSVMTPKIEVNHVL